MGVGKLFEATGELIREVEKWGAFTAGSSGGKIWSGDVTHEHFLSVEGVKSWIERSRARGQSHLEYSATSHRLSIRNDPTDDVWGSDPTPFAGLGNSSPVQAFLSEATNMPSRDGFDESLWYADEYSFGPRSYPSKQGRAGQTAHQVEPYEEEDAVGDAELVRKLQEMNFSCDPDMLSPSPSKPKTTSPVSSLLNYTKLL